MTKDWIARLQEVIRNDKRSNRAISEAAGAGVNYVQQFLKDGKEPGADRLARLLKALGGESALYVFTGIRASKEDLELLELLSALPHDSRARALDFFRSLARHEGSEGPEHDRRHQDQTRS